MRIYTIRSLQNRASGTSDVNNVSCMDRRMLLIVQAM